MCSLADLAAVKHFQRPEADTSSTKETNGEAEAARPPLEGYGQLRHVAAEESHQRSSAIGDTEIA